MGKTSNFRLDINGLRFIAVAGVVLFHFKFGFLKAGYAGVDIFFVISGYLMHEIIKNSPTTLNAILGFYHRRIKRVYPALLVAVVLFSLFSALISPPSILKSQLKEVLSALTFTSNFFYWKSTSSYFSSAADSFFLLHTWSLGVEFQFYLLFPIVIFIINKMKVNKSIAFGLITVVSFLLCYFITKHHASAGFYLFPFRAWELFLGAFASSLQIKNKHAKLTEKISVAGIVLFVLLFNSQQPWPNLYAFIPTLLTALVLHARLENSDVATRNPVMQKIGLWSYSIYLYHWPVYSFLYLQGITLTPLLKCAGLAISVVLGAVSYHFIEKRLTFNWKKYVLVIAAFCAALSMLSFTSITSFWLKNDVIQLDKMSVYNTSAQFGINKDKLCFLTSTYNSTKYFNFERCTKVSSTKPNLLLLGDSHAAQFSKSLKDLADKFNVIQITASGCPAVIDSQGTGYCTELMRFAFKNFIVENKIQAVILASDWSLFYKNNEDLDGKISRTLDYLKKYVDNYYVIGQTKHFEPSMYHLLQIYGARTDINSHRDVTLDVVHEHINKAVKDHVIDLYNYGCNNGCLFYKDNTPMFFDNNHFSLKWANEIVEESILPLLNHSVISRPETADKQASASIEIHNVFNKNESHDRHSISWVNGAISTSENYAVTGLIPITKNKPFIISSDTNALCFYDENSDFISNPATHSGKTGQPIVPPENARFIQFQVTPAVRVESLMVTEGRKNPKGYTPYGEIISHPSAYGKNVLWLGDSITHTGNYIPYTIARTGMKSIANYAVPGSGVGSMADKITPQILANTGVISIFGGTNDYGGSRPLGSIQDARPDYDDSVHKSFYFDVYQVLHKIYSIEPDAKVVFSTPLTRKKIVVDGVPVSRKNKAGYRLEDYVKAIKEVSKRYPVTVCDLFSESGITSSNLSQYTLDAVHPNREGGELISKKMSMCINALFQQ